MASYKRELVKGLNWNTNLTAFLPYSSSDPSLSEWTWINSFGFNLWKGIGVGLEFGLRNAYHIHFKRSSFRTNGSADFGAAVCVLLLATLLYS